jgi:N-acetylmuramoyl-L-alanine amidase
MIILHYTAVNFQESLDILTKPSANPVSSHYLIPAPNDPSYPHKNLKTYQLVPETLRAWHAGPSYWAGKYGLNDQSIGIEIVNVPICKGNSSPEIIDISIELDEVCSFKEYPASQIALLLELLSDLMKRYPEIKPTHIIGHADILPDYKIDPGPLFPWKLLYENGFGAWYDDDTQEKYDTYLTTNPLGTQILQKALTAYGYKVDATGTLDVQTRKAIRAFQLHFQPNNISGISSKETSAILFALIEKYYPEKLNGLLPVPKQTAHTK